MMPGNPVVGGTVLRRAAIQSPDFVHGQAGWAISADGTAEFQDVILPGGTSGVTATFAVNPPAGPRSGDLWYNTGRGAPDSAVERGGLGSVPGQRAGDRPGVPRPRV